MLLRGQTSSISHYARRRRYHTWRLSPPPCQRQSASLTCWHSSGTVCLTQIREDSYVGRPEVLAGSEERALQAGGTIMSWRPELHLEGSDAIDGPVSTDTHPIAVIPIAHETTCLQNIHAHFGFCLCLAKGQKASGRAQPTCPQEVLPPFSAKPPKHPLFHIHLYVRNYSGTPYNHSPNVKWD